VTELSGQSVTELLDEGSKMLLYFEAFGPLYTRAFGNSSANILGYEKLREHYYEQNGMNEAALVDAFEAVSAAAKAMADEHGTQQTISQNISQAWQGTAASDAASMIKTQLDLASGDAEAAKNIADALELAPAALRAAVKTKSDNVANILDNGEVRVDGKSKEDVEAIVAGSEGVGLSNLYGSDTLVNKIRRIFPDMEEGWIDGAKTFGNLVAFKGLVVAGTPYANMIKDRCQDWLDAVFKIEYPQKMATFIDACDLTNDKVIEAYKTITDAMTGLKTKSYPRPVGTPSQNQLATDPAGDTPASGTPASGTPSTGTPAGDTPPSTDTPTTPASTPSSNPTNADTDDDSTNPASTSNPLSGLTNLSQIASQLSPLLTTLTESVQTALTSLTTTVDEEIDKALENLKNLTSTENPAEGVDTDGDGKPDEQTKPLAEFDLAGKEVTFEQGADGLKMVVTNPDGTTTEYRMTIDENGVPLISTESGEPVGEGEVGEETPAEGTPAVGEQPAGAGVPSSVPATPAPGKQEEDGEYTPQPIPAPEFTEPEPAVPAPAEPVSDQPPVGDTGALLAEAGPL